MIRGCPRGYRETPFKYKIALPATHLRWCDGGPCEIARLILLAAVIVSRGRNEATAGSDNRGDERAICH